MVKTGFIFVAGTLSIAFLCGPGSAAPVQGKEDVSPALPGYYEFFMKTGKLTRLPSEVKRDEEIETGKLVPVAVNEPVVELTLPDGFGRLHNTRDWVGKKNLVLITGRAWW